MKRLAVITAALAYIMSVGFLAAPAAYAIEDKKCSDSTFEFNNKGGDNRDKCVYIRDVIIEVFKVGTALVGILAVGGYAYGGIVYSTSGGNPGQAQKAITIMANTTLGIIVFFGMYGIVVFFIPETVLK